MSYFKKINPIVLSVLLIIIIASFLRLYNLKSTPPGLYPDEAMNGNNALEALVAKDFKVFYPENNGREGLFINIQAVSVAIFGNYPWALRLPSAIFGILTVLGLYFLVKKLFKKEIIALLSSFLLATSFWHINFSRVGFRAIMAPFFLIWAIYFLLKVFKTSDAEHPTRPVLFAILAGIFYGLGFYSYIAYRATPVLIGIILWLLWKKSKILNTQKIFLKLTGVFLLTTFLIALPLGIYFLKNPADFLGRTGQISIFSSSNPLATLGSNIVKTMGMFNFAGDYNWRHNIAGAPELFWPIGILFITGIIIGIIALAKRKIQNPGDSSDYLKFGIIISFSWLIITALPVIISNESIPHALRAIIMIPPIFILAGIGGYYVFHLFNKHLTSFRLIICAVILLMLITQAYYSYFILWAKNPNTADAFSQNYVKLGEKLNSLPKNLPKYVIVEAPGVMVRGLPMPAQTTMFITDSFTPEKQKQNNIFYVLPEQINEIPFVSHIEILK